MKSVFLFSNRLKSFIAISFLPFKIVLLIGLPVKMTSLSETSFKTLKAEQIKLAFLANHLVVNPGKEFCSCKIIGILGFCVTATNNGTALAYPPVPITNRGLKSL